ncbi:phosphatidylserine decarboxylase [Pseudaminobacter salicylatoxidans]|uniref:Phosphatidylserine decarboxylase proenzyme n=1 Tax=Pseudaminobacter salicylatoxidans TaxID=93369 RepID=A0A316C2N8_PSESE|nr:phosphatidylserine decarboxylase [Pseudaminobacter salicylatoxidans]PWJ82338.1 phosphatidylserine decarboxylase [Pseudaminobacter salicylatoxidans]
MSIGASIKNGLVPIHKAGYPFIAIGIVAMAGFAFLSASLAWLSAIVTLWVCYFFRDPPRTTPVQDGLVVAPADGRVSMITEILPPPELDMPAERMLRISIFLSIFDCHVNRAPIAGRIARIAYTPGRFFNADLDKASEYNERNAIALDTIHGPVVVVQIAGFIARRIVHWVAEDHRLEMGHRFGLVRFGSRLDVYLPVGTPVLVAVGQIATAGETVLADFRGPMSERGYSTT